MKDIKVLVNAAEITESVDKVAREIVADNENNDKLYFVTVLLGARRFSEDLKARIEAISSIKVENYDIRVQSYDGTQSTGKVRVVQDISQDIKGLDIILIDDIFDSGVTLEFLSGYLVEQKEARSVKRCALLVKDVERTIDIELDYHGRSIPDEYVFGYGLDKDGKLRELQDICYED